MAPREPGHRPAAITAGSEVLPGTHQPIPGMPSQSRSKCCSGMHRNECTSARAHHAAFSRKSCSFHVTVLLNSPRSSTSVHDNIRKDFRHTERAEEHKHLSHLRAMQVLSSIRTHGNCSPEDSQPLAFSNQHLSTKARKHLLKHRVQRNTLVAALILTNPSLCFPPNSTPWAHGWEHSVLEQQHLLRKGECFTCFHLRLL